MLGHAISWAESGTFTHAALERNGLVVEAVYPRVHALTPERSAAAVAGASERVPLLPHSDGLDAQVWAALLTEMVGKPYSLLTLLADGVANLVGFRAVVRLGGSVVCSVLAGRYAQLVGDPRVPSWADADQFTPADLGQMLIGRRLPHP